MQPLEQTVQRDEAGAAQEDAVDRARNAAARRSLA